MDAHSRTWYLLRLTPKLTDHAMKNPNGPSREEMDDWHDALADMESDRVQNNATSYMRAANQMDWTQVVMNGGPPCFHVCDDGRFCGRAERWDGHEAMHKYISLPDLLKLVVDNHDSNKCSLCGVRPRRGGNRKGPALCQQCYQCE